MFSGIVEAQMPVLEIQEQPSGLKVRIGRPNEFSDLRVGDSVAVDGVCLTIEALESELMTFTLGEETLKITGWNGSNLHQRPVNLERSMALGERLHGHLVSGHVDGVATVLSLEDRPDWRQLTLSLPESLRTLIWHKGSITVQGVSLTVNRITPTEFEVGLIPETLRRTNLATLKVGDKVNLEVDMVARGLVHWFASSARPPWN